MPASIAQFFQNCKGFAQFAKMGKYQFNKLGKRLDKLGKVCYDKRNKKRRTDVRKMARFMP